MGNCGSDIEFLRSSVRSRMDDRRYAHTLGVERMALHLGELYLPEKVDELRCAALLHDITKNETDEKQLQYCGEFDIIVRDFDKISGKLLHAKTAASLIEREYPEYATADVVSAVRWHTTGHDGMSIFDMLIYLADYIEDTRAFDDCIRVRDYFLNADPCLMGEKEKIVHLHKTAVLSVDLTLKNLISDGVFIDEDTVGFRNYCLRKIGDWKEGVITL